MKHIVRALKYRNFRLFFGGQTISLIGTWMTQVALSWLVYRLSHSAFLLGLVAFSMQIPIFIFSAFAGVWIDRLRVHRVLITTQILAMIQSLTLALLTLTKLITIPQIIVLSLVQGLINVFDMPARQAFVVQMVDDKKDLGNAIALNSFMFNLARLIGPTIAGIIIIATGEGICFLIDGISYIAVIVSLMLMLIRPQIKQKTHPRLLHQLIEGARYAFGFLPIRNVLLLTILFSLMGMPYSVLMPIFAAEVFKGGAHTYGFLMAASGIGALVGSILLAYKRTVLGLDKIMVFAGILFGAGLILFSLSKMWYLSLFLLGITGLSMIMVAASVSTFLQTIAEDTKRGRLMSLFTIAFIGMIPFGSLLSGGLAKYFGAPWTLFIEGAFCVLGTLVFWKTIPHIKKHVRPIYVDLGILPP